MEVVSLEGVEVESGSTCSEAPLSARPKDYLFEARAQAREPPGQTTFIIFSGPLNTRQVYSAVLALSNYLRFISSKNPYLTIPFSLHAAMSLIS